MLHCKQYFHFKVIPKKQKKMRFPCKKCNEECTDETIQCDECKLWFHFQCEDLKKSEFEEFAKSEMTPYICTSCRPNYFLWLNRKVQHFSKTSFHSLNEFVNDQKFLKLLPPIIVPTKPLMLENLKIDLVSMEFLKITKKHQNKKALHVKGDGNCLFNAISVALTGNENISKELKLRTFIELIFNRKFYEEIHKNTGIEWTSPTMESSIISCAQDGGYSSNFTIHAAATVIGKAITTIYPPVNGHQDGNIAILNRTFEPRFSMNEDHQIFIMWTSATGHKNESNAMWMPNHFVPLIDETGNALFNIEALAELNDAEFDATNSLSPCTTKSHTKEYNHQLPYNQAIDNNSPFDNLSLSDQNIDLNSISDPSSLSDQNIEINSTFDHQSHSDQDINASLTLNKTVFDQDQREAGGFSLPNDKFLPLKEAVNILISSRNIVQNIPNGEKTNVYFVVNNQGNVDRRNKNIYSEYHDDCGVWDRVSGSCPSRYFSCNSKGEINSLYLHRGKYCSRKQINRKYVYTPFDPQPIDVLKLKNYYCILKGNDNYRRKITYITSIPSNKFDLTSKMIENCCKRMLVEYRGKNVKGQPHGNIKNKIDAPPFMRTNPLIMDKIKMQLKNGNSAKDTYELFQLPDSNNISDCARDSRQVRNIKYNLDKQKRVENEEKLPNKNFSDHILIIANKLHERPQFVRSLLIEKSSPSIILFSDQMIESIKNLCNNEQHKSVLCIDRTFNLCDVYVTITSYKHNGLVSKRSHEPPIFIGPILLHGKATYDVYHFFLSKLAASLGSNNQPQLIIGSDEETALRKAIKNVFPDSSNILCSRHLKKFFENFLQNKIGLNKVFRTKFLKMIFGNTGLIHSKSVSEFEDNVKMILNKISLLIPNSTKLENYLCGPRGFITSIRTGVIEPSIRHKLPPNWTNNNAESINHVIKSAINWKILTLPNLVDKLQRITDVQELEIVKVLQGIGNYSLAPHMTSHLTSPRLWGSLSQEEISNKVSDFNKMKCCVSSKGGKIVTSSDGKLNVNLPSAKGQKPNQRRRRRAERVIK